MNDQELEQEIQANKKVWALEWYLLKEQLHQSK